MICRVHTYLSILSIMMIMIICMLDYISVIEFDIAHLMAFIPPIPIGKWYQEAVINGVEMLNRRVRDTSEKRWLEFIEPFVDKDGSGKTFIELGSNAGFYLRKVADFGYKVIGVENNQEFIEHANYWEMCDPKGVVTINTDLNDFNIPCCNTVLLANVHYWLTPSQVKKVVLMLRGRAVNIIIVGRHRAVKIHNSPCDMESLIRDFIGWDVIGKVVGEKHYSVLFMNPNLTDRKIKDIYYRPAEFKFRQFVPAYNQLVHLILSGVEFNCNDTLYYKYLDERENSGKKWIAFNKNKIFDKRIRLIGDLAHRGIIKPIRIDFYGRIIDGNHRFAFANYIGIERMVCKYSMLNEYKDIRTGDFCKVDVDSLFHKQPFVISGKFLPSFNEFIDIVASADSVDYKDTKYYKYLNRRGIGSLLSDHIRLVRGVSSGRRIKEIKVRGNLVVDGNHRLIVAHRFGVKSIECEMI